MFLQFIAKDERRKVIEPFFAYVKERYEDATAKLEKYKEQLEPFPLLPSRIRGAYAQKSIRFPPEIDEY
jgi:hypothetical protein